MLRHGATDILRMARVRRWRSHAWACLGDAVSAFAVEEMREFNDGGKKAGRPKSCPKGARYSEKKRGCVKTSCAAGQVWSSGTDACIDGRSASL